MSTINEPVLRVMFTFTDCVEFDAGEIVGKTESQIKELARLRLAGCYDGQLVDGAYLLLNDAECDLECL